MCLANTIQLCYSFMKRAGMVPGPEDDQNMFKGENGGIGSHFSPQATPPYHINNNHGRGSWQ